MTEGVREVLGPLRNQRLCALDTVSPDLATSLTVALTRTELILTEAEEHHLPARVREDLGVVRGHLLGLCQLAHELPVLCSGLWQRLLGWPASERGVSVSYPLRCSDRFAPAANTPRPSALVAATLLTGVEGNEAR
jgi:hypothetical protein